MLQGTNIGWFQIEQGKVCGSYTNSPCTPGIHQVSGRQKRKQG